MFNTLVFSFRCCDCYGSNFGVGKIGLCVILPWPEKEMYGDAKKVNQDL